MKDWIEVIFWFLLINYCIIGTNLINKYIFDYSLTGIYFGLVMVVVFISAYPIFGWNKSEPWKSIGRWSFTKWIVMALCAGIIALLADAISYKITSYFARM